MDSSSILEAERHGNQGMNFPLILASSEEFSTFSACPKPNSDIDRDSRKSRAELGCLDREVESNRLVFSATDQ